jgi:predicted dehydrogenase
MSKLRVGLVGCGNISDTYLGSPEKFPIFEIVAVADLNEERAKEKARKHEISRVVSVDEIASAADIDIILNLTVPAAHYSICATAIAHGKHIYTEKPLSITLEQGRNLIKSAKEKGVRIGSAPDTFLGGGIQTCRQLIDSGAIGVPVAAAAFMQGHGPEAWHPDPDFFYKAGAGPMFDVGVYYITALVSLLGPIAAVSAMSRISFPERVIGSGINAGNKISVETPTHITGSMEFTSGLVSTMTASFDVWHSQVPRVEIYGSEGTLSVPDPNTFGGPVKLRLAKEKEWQEVPITRPYTTNSRGIGLADMIYAIDENREHRASGDLALHTLEAMHAFLTSSKNRQYCEMESTVTRPAPLPEVWP